MDAFQYAANCELNWKRMLSEFGEYKPFTTFYNDLSIAEFVSVKGVKGTFNNIVKYWLGDYKYFTEFVLCLNHKAWEMSARAEKGGDIFPKERLEELCELYSDLYEKAQDKFYEHYEGNSVATEYYFNVTD